MSERRHRIVGLEIDEVILGLRLRLRYHYQKKEDLPSATTAFRCYFRLTNHKAGRPDYPDPIDWDVIKDHLGNGTII